MKPLPLSQCMPQCLVLATLAACSGQGDDGKDTGVPTSVAPEAVADVTGAEVGLFVGFLGPDADCGLPVVSQAQRTDQLCPDCDFQVDLVLAFTYQAADVDFSRSSDAGAWCDYSDAYMAAYYDYVMYNGDDDYAVYNGIRGYSYSVIAWTADFYGQGPQVLLGTSYGFVLYQDNPYRYTYPIYLYPAEGELDLDAGTITARRVDEFYTTYVHTSPGENRAFYWWSTDLPVYADDYNDEYGWDMSTVYGPYYWGTEVTARLTGL